MTIGNLGKPAPPFPLSDLRIVHAKDQRLIRKTWENNREEWGAQVDPAVYIERETVLASSEFSKQNLATWILVPSQFDEDDPNSDLDLILSAIEIYDRSALVATKAGQVQDVTATSIASVFCPLKYRGYGYASLMMRLVWKFLAERGDVSFTFLYSDVGDTFYARSGWVCRESNVMSIPTDLDLDLGDTPPSTALSLDFLSDEQLKQVVALDTTLLRASFASEIPKAHVSSPSLSLTPSSDALSKVRVAVLPQVSSYDWLFARSRFVAQKIMGLPRNIVHLGAKVSLDPACFVLWFHDFVEKKLVVLRLRLEGSDNDLDHIAKAHALLQAAQNEARAWGLNKVEIWNPDPSLKVVTNNQAEIERRTSSFSCLGMMSDEFAQSEVEWVINEKYAWC